MALDHVQAVMNRIAKALGYEEAALTEIGRTTRDPFRVLISCILSLRTRDETTTAASKRLFALARKPHSMRKLAPAKIEKAIYPVGFYRTKARTIIKICNLLLDEHGSKVPDTIEELVNLPGVGRKTANIVMVYGYRKPALPIDTHCHRIPNRIGWVKTKHPDETEAVLRQKLPKKYWMTFNDCFVQFGQKICRPVGPRCPECPIAGYCKKVGVK